MSHLDEGTLHALLDGELDLHEVKEIQAHIGSCAACGTRLREVKEFHGESDRLVALLEVPTTPSRLTAAPPDSEPDVVSEEASAAPQRPPRRPPRASGPAAEPPPLLLPDNSGYGRGGAMRRMRWAALILVTAGAGYIGNQMRQSGEFDFDGPPSPVALGDSSPGAVLSSEESMSAAEPGDAGNRPQSGAAQTDTAAGKAKSSPSVPKREAPTPEALAPTKPPAEPRAPANATRDRAEPPAAAGTVRGTDTAVGETETADEESADEGGQSEGRATTESQVNVRTEAARALRQLDIERQRDRAAAATAALDSARRRDQALARQAAVAPAPRTPEQRAQTYLRIGLDEASKQLGRPVHVIEGMSPLFMGLTLGRNSPGADATRPVVRVVYQDSQGRLILLDQQRLRPGEATSSPGAEPHWSVGEVSLHLSGEVSPDVLRNLRARVR
jgi:anti-sigma factor RsiW